MRDDVDISLLDSDYLARYKIVNYVNNNYFVEAAAGSGKTYSLTQRLVSMVESGVDVKNITTITFTKAAANEFFDRFQSLLSERCNESDKTNPLKPTDLPYTTEESRKLCAEALKDIDLCFLGTIDAFCNTLAKEHPVELGIPATSEVISNEQLSNELKKVLSDVLNGEYTKELQDLAIEYYSLADKPVDAFVAGLTYIMEHRDGKIIYPPFTSTNIDVELASVIKALRDLINLIEANKHLIKDTKTAKKGFKVILFNKRRIFSSWKGQIKNVKSTIKSIGELTFENTVAGTRLETDGLAIQPSRGWKTNPAVIDPLMDAVNNYCFMFEMNFFMKLMDIIDKKFKEKGILTFFDYLYHLRNTMKEDAKNGGSLAKQIFKKHSYFLIDESQDTNPLQTELMFYLTAKESKENWDECEPKPGSLFIVGDPKQSIYRFRGADVSAYNYTKSLFDTKNFGEVLYMTRNFRSTSTVRNWFTRTMTPLLNIPGEVENCEHLPIPAEDDADKIQIESKVTSGIYKYSVKKEDRSVNKNDAEAVSNIILNIVQNPDYTLYDKKLKIFRHIEFKDIMVITYNTTMDEHIDSFLNNHIPFNAEGKTLFENSKSLDVFKKYLKVLFDPFNKNALLELLRSEAFNYSIIQIQELKDSGYEFILSSDIPDNIDAKLKGKLTDLKNTFERVKNMSCSGILQYLMNHERIFEEHGVEFIECVYYTLAILEDLVSRGMISSPKDLIDALEVINSHNKTYERCLRFSETINCVKIANVHKVKGLQAPVCILATPSNRERDVETYTKRVGKSNESYIFKLSDSVKKINYLKTTLNDALIPEATQYAKAEKRRIEYVAATRAENILIIGEAYKVDKKDKMTDISNAWDDILKCDKSIPPFPFDYSHSADFTSLEEKVSKFTETENKDDSNDHKLNNQIDFNDNTESTYRIVKPSAVRMSGVSTVKDKDDDEVSAGELINETETNELDPKLTGTLVHKLLELMIKSNFKLSLDNIDKLMSNEYKEQIYNKYKVIIHSVYTTMTNGGYKQSDGSTADLFAELKAANEVMSEVPFAFMDGTNLVNGYIDLVYKKDNKWYIVDYKTNSEGDVNKLFEHYKGQLSMYKKAFKKQTGLDAETRIYHIDI